MHIKEERNGDSSCIKPVLQPPPSFEAVKIQPSETRGNPSCDANSQAKGTVNVSCINRVSSMEYFSNFLTLRKSSRRITQINSKSSFVWNLCCKLLGTTFVWMLQWRRTKPLKIVSLSYYSDNTKVCVFSGLGLLLVVRSFFKWKFCSQLLYCFLIHSIQILYRFTFKVVVKIEEAPDMILECFGSPHGNKKAAAEHAAEGALWYLRNGGYISSSD